MIAATALAALAAASSAAAQFTRINPDECPAADADVNLAALAAELGNAVECNGTATCDLEVTVAQDFGIEYFPGFKVASNTALGDPFISILYPCGQEQPTGADIEAVQARDNSGILFLEVPLTAVVTGDTTAAYALEAIGVSDRVRFAGKTSTSPCLVQRGNPIQPDPTYFGEPAPGCGFVFNDDYEADPTPLRAFDAEFSFMGNSTTKSVQFTSPADPSPIARVQHLVYMAAFFNKEAAATAAITQVTQAYNRLVVGSVAADAPVVAFVSVAAEVNEFSEIVDADGEAITSGFAHTVSFAPYKTTLIQDAGGTNLVMATVQAAETGGAMSSSLTAGDGVTFADALYATPVAAATALKTILADVDIVIDESFPSLTSAEDLMTALNITQAEMADFPFLVNSQIYRQDLTQSARPSAFDPTIGASDQFGQAVFRPDLLLADLAAVVSGDTTVTRTFLRNIAEGETPMYVTGAECEAECGAFDAQEPLPLGTTAAAAGAAGADASDGDSATLGGTGGVGGVPDETGGAARGALGGAASCVSAAVLALAMA